MDYKLVLIFFFSLEQYNKIMNGDLSLLLCPNTADLPYTLTSLTSPRDTSVKSPRTLLLPPKKACYA